MFWFKRRAPRGSFSQRKWVLDHEKLDVYQIAIEFVVLADGIVEHLPRGRAYLSDQLHRYSRFNFKRGIWTAPKFPGLNDHKWVHISNIDPFMIVQSRGFRAVQMGLLNLNQL